MQEAVKKSPAPNANLLHPIDNRNRAATTGSGLPIFS